MRITCLAFILLMISALPAGALTMEEVVSLAQENNHRIKEYQHRRDAQEDRVGSERSGFMPDLNIGYNFTRQDNILSYQTKEASTASIEMKYNLFNGFIDSNSLNEARQLLDAETYQKKAVQADVIFEVKTAYIDLLRARKNLDINREAVGLIERQKREADLFHKAGLIARNDLLKIEVELASARQDLLKAESGVRVAINVLERKVGVTIDRDEGIEDLDHTADLDTDYGKLADDVLDSRSEISYLKALMKAKYFAMMSSRGEYLPTLDLSLKYSRFGDSASPTGRTGLYDDEKKAMVTMEWELAAGIKKRHDVRVAEAGIREVGEKIRDMTDELLLQLKDAVEGYRLAMGMLEVAEKAVEQAEENYRLSENRFNQRMATVTDLLDDRVYLSRARNYLNNSRYDLHKAIAQIERVTEK